MVAGGPFRKREKEVGGVDQNHHKEQAEKSKEYEFQRLHSPQPPEQSAF